MKKPLVQIKRSVWTLMKLIVKYSPIETNAIGWTRRLNENLFTVDRIILADYKGTKFPGYDYTDLPTGVSVTVDPEIKLEQQSKAYHAGFDLNFHFHSHVNMPAFWSGTDINLQKKWNGRYLIAIVMNKAEEYEANVVDAFINCTETRKCDVQIVGKDLSWQQVENWKLHLKEYYKGYAYGRTTNGFQETNRYLQS